MAETGMASILPDHHADDPEMLEGLSQAAARTVRGYVVTRTGRPLERSVARVQRDRGAAHLSES